MNNPALLQTILKIDPYNLKMEFYRVAWYNHTSQRIMDCPCFKAVFLDLCDQHGMWETDKNICVFLQYQNLLNLNRFTKYHGQFQTKLSENSQQWSALYLTLEAQWRRSGDSVFIILVPSVQLCVVQVRVLHPCLSLMNLVSSLAYFSMFHCCLILHI